MRVLVDTSTWADYFNGYPSPEARVLRELLEGAEEICTCGVVVAEVFQGLRRDQTRTEIEALFRELSYIEGGIDVYLRAAEMFRKLRKSGRTVRSTIDCALAALAESHRCAILARDRDLTMLATSGVADVGLWSV